MPASGCFDNELLEQTKQRSSVGQGSLLYVWSPRMSYSVEQAYTAAHTAHAQGLAFVPLHDASVPPAEVNSLLRRISQSRWHNGLPLVRSQALCAEALIERDALRHFPTSFVLTAHGIHPFAIVGAMPPRAWQHSIAQRLATPPAASATPAAPAAMTQP
jgi:hypothetical protein